MIGAVSERKVGDVLRLVQCDSYAFDYCNLRHIPCFFDIGKKVLLEVPLSYTLVDVTSILINWIGMMVFTGTVSFLAL